MWTLISSAADIKTGMELFHSYNAHTGKVFKVVYVSEGVMQVIPVKYITAKGEFYITSLNSNTLAFDMNKVSNNTFYAES